MIATVRGRVASLGPEAAVVEVGGVGLLVSATPGTLAALRVGEPAELATSLVVREDALTLFGFLDADERAVFELLQTVTGVGPRLALAILGVFHPDELRRAVASADVAALTRVPGVGRKGAQRLLLELGDRLGPPSAGAQPSRGTAGEDVSGQVVSALVGLGWQTREASAAVEAVLAESGPSSAVADDVPTVLRAALQRLGRVA